MLLLCGAFLAEYLSKRFRIISLATTGKIKTQDDAIRN